MLWRFVHNSHYRPIHGGRLEFILSVSGSQKCDRDRRTQQFLGSDVCQLTGTQEGQYHCRASWVFARWDVRPRDHFEPVYFWIVRGCRSQRNRNRLVYLIALSDYLAGDLIGAEARLAEAVALEKKHPVSNWGQVMERIQGRSRIWLEDGRRRAI
jgi:hypothetical protein